MTGIGGVRMWLDDFMINSSSYDEKYRKNFIKVRDAWNECMKEFKECKTVTQCNDTYTKWANKVDELNQDMYYAYGKGKIPCGISDTLDYFEDAVGELEDKALDKIHDNPNPLKITIPVSYEGKAREVADLYEIDYPDLKFEATEDNNYITVQGQYLEVGSFLQEEFDMSYYSDAYKEIMSKGVFLDE